MGYTKSTKPFKSPTYFTETALVTVNLCFLKLISD